MSAFMCDDSLFQDLAQVLPFDYTRCQGMDLVSAILGGGKVIRPLNGDRVETTNAMIADWMKANRMAVNSRYRANDPVPEPVVYRESLAWASNRAEKARGVAPKVTGNGPNSTRAYGPDKPNLLVIHKHLVCLQYQCSEDVPADHQEWHQSIKDEIRYAIEKVSYAIISELPEWDNLNWGRSGVRDRIQTANLGLKDADAINMAVAINVADQAAEERRIRGD